MQYSGKLNFKKITQLEKCWSIYMIDWWYRHLSWWYSSLLSSGKALYWYFGYEAAKEKNFKFQLISLHEIWELIFPLKWLRLNSICVISLVSCPSVKCTEKNLEFSMQFHPPCYDPSTEANFSPCCYNEACCLVWLNIGHL